METNCRLDDDEGSVVIAVGEGPEPQALWVRVGPVFGPEGQRGEPGVWIEYHPLSEVSDYRE